MDSRTRRSILSIFTYYSREVLWPSVNKRMARSFSISVSYIILSASRPSRKRKKNRRNLMLVVMHCFEFSVFFISMFLVATVKLFPTKRETFSRCVIQFIELRSEEFLKNWRKMLVFALPSVDCQPIWLLFLFFQRRRNENEEKYFSIYLKQPKQIVKSRKKFNSIQTKIIKTFSEQHQDGIVYYRKANEQTTSTKIRCSNYSELSYYLARWKYRWK